MNRSRRLRWAGHIARMEQGRSPLKILPGKPTGKRPLGRSKRRWENKIRMDFKETDIHMSNWVVSAERTFVNFSHKTLSSYCFI